MPGEVLFDFERDTEGWSADPNVGCWPQTGAALYSEWTGEKAYRGSGSLRFYFDYHVCKAGGVSVQFPESALADFQDKLLSVWVWVPKDSEAEIFIQSAAWAWAHSPTIKVTGGVWSQMTWDLSQVEVGFENAVRKLGVQIGQWNVVETWSGDVYVDYFTVSTPVCNTNPNANTHSNAYS